MMKSLTSLLTRSKSVPVSDDQVRRHREQRRQCDEWRADVDRLKAITDRLRTEYARHKGDFAVGRYEELKSMVKTAVEELSSTVSENKDRRQTGALTYGRKTGAISGLKSRAESYAEVQNRIRADEKYYSDLSPAHHASEIERLRRDIVQLKQDFQSERDRLERLDVAYQDSKRLNPAQRYAALKDMIKDATTTTAAAPTRAAHQPTAKS